MLQNSFAVPLNRVWVVLYGNAWSRTTRSGPSNTCVSRTCESTPGSG
jgi:hypothetical protein